MRSEALMANGVFYLLKIHWCCSFCQRYKDGIYYEVEQSFVRGSFVVFWVISRRGVTSFFLDKSQFQNLQ